MSLGEATVHGVGTNLHVTHGDDSGLFVEFYKNPMNDKDYIHIAIPGDKTTDIRRPATDRDKERFFKHWESYERGMNQDGGGTPLENFPPLDEGRRMELRAMNIFTVEQLAKLTDSVLARVGMDARLLREKAQLFVEKENAPAKAREMEEQNKALQAQLASLAEQVQALQEKPKRGRPRKDDAA